jgi:hypothetical protein
VSLLVGCAWLPGPETDPEPTTLVGTRGLSGAPDSDARATRTYLATLDFAGPPRRSRVRCHGNAQVQLDVYPERNSHLVDPRRAQIRGRIVAMVKNVDTVRCNDMRLAPGDSAYWWMGPGADYPLITEFYSISPSGDIRRVARTGPVTWHRDGQRIAPDAVISDSLVHPVRGDDDNGDLEPLRFGHNSTWIACLGGCCESANMLES